MLARFIERQKKELQDRVQAIADVGTNLLIVRDGVNDDAIPMLRKAGIVTYRRVERDDLELIARACGASIIRDTRGINSESLGNFGSVILGLLVGIGIILYPQLEQYLHH